MTLVQWIVILVALQRVGELLHARHNTAWLIAQGGVEIGAGHYPAMVLLHAAWLAALFFLVPADAPIIWWLVAVFVLLQVARLWVLAALGRFWTTRIITLPDAPLITGGPYRFCRHPNYAIVTAEIAILPLAFGAWEIALAFSLLNGLLLLYRIRMEDAVLSPRRATGRHTEITPDRSRRHRFRGAGPR